MVGVDGNPFSVLETRNFPHGGKATFRRMDLQSPFPSDLGVFDWAMSFAVVEHVPFQYEHIFLANLQRVARKGILLVWDELPSSGTGHVNCRDEPEVLRIFDALGFYPDLVATSELRGVASHRWYRLALVLRRRPFESMWRPGKLQGPGLPLDEDAARCWDNEEKM